MFRITGNIELSPSCNIFGDQNNVGKSTLLKGILAFQGSPFLADMRPGSTTSFHTIVVTDIKPTDFLRFKPTPSGTVRVIRVINGQPPSGFDDIPLARVGDDGGQFSTSRPNHFLVPFLAKRKAPQYDHNITSIFQVLVSGTFANLYSRIDLVATAGHPHHERFQNAIKQIIGIPITTKATPNGKEAGFYYDELNFVSLERMGDGVLEMVALIVELCVERNKVFVLEEPESNLHPHGLKALLGLIRSSLETNQFIISTHSNIVVRELASDSSTKNLTKAAGESENFWRFYPCPPSSQVSR